MAILDADKEGFLRSAMSMIQTVGRAARNVDGRVIMYADSVTESMRVAIGETERRRGIQVAFNEAHGIVPESVRKAVRDLSGIQRAAGGGRADEAEAESQARADLARGRGRGRGDVDGGDDVDLMDERQLAAKIKELSEQMKKAAALLDFEQAAALRDRIFELRRRFAEL